MSTQLAPRAHQASATAGPALRPGVLLDRDGTIIVDHGYVGSVDRVDLIPGAAEAIALFNRAGIPVAVITNQSGVARGLYGPDDVRAVHSFLDGQLAHYGARVDRYFFCPYHPEGTVDRYARVSPDRKPGPGMAQQAAEALHLDLPASWMVGDRPEDVGVGLAVGASVAYLGVLARPAPRVHAFPDLATAAPFIVERIAP
ncbi:MAG TPA: HAD family hydrolase [Acidimicrobiales bacterium]|nr:HAD family hydrolase [Acidimicrobiales bacterium]